MSIYTHSEVMLGSECGKSFIVLNTQTDGIVHIGLIYEILELCTQYLAHKQTYSTVC